MKQKSTKTTLKIVIALAIILPDTVLTEPILGGSVIVKTTAEVRAKNLPHPWALLSDDFYLVSPPNNSGIIFNNHTSPIGAEVSLGTFQAGTELIFRIHVNAGVGYDCFTGPGSRNPDGVPHAIVREEFGPNETSVAFEDLLGAPGQVSHFNYGDLIFSFTNTRATENPPPLRTHLGCRENTCREVVGQGPDHCSTNNDCLGEFHTFSCEASEGRNPYRQGSVRQSRDGEQIEIYQDKCCLDVFLKEYLCNAQTDQYEYQWYQCKYCEGGHCVQELGDAFKIDERPLLQNGILFRCNEYDVFFGE